RLVGLQDHTGRNVSYTWNGDNQLTGINDVLGETWGYAYTDSAMTQTDPEGRQTTITRDSKGRLLSIFDSDGVGQRYRYGYNESDGEYYLSSTDGTGRVKETWYDEHGLQLRHDRDGENQFKSEFVASDGS